MMMTDAVRCAIKEMRLVPHGRRRLSKWISEQRLRAVLWLGSTVAGEWFRHMGTTQVEALTALDWVSYACVVMENDSDPPITEDEWELLFFGVAALWDAPKVYPSREATTAPWQYIAPRFA